LNRLTGCDHFPSVTSSDDGENEEEKVDDVKVELNCRQVGIVQTVAVLPLPDYQLRVVDEVDAEDDGSQTGIDQLQDRVVPENKNEAETYQPQQHHHQVRPHRREVRLCHTYHNPSRTRIDRQPHHHPQRQPHRRKNSDTRIRRNTDGHQETDHHREGDEDEECVTAEGLHAACDDTGEGDHEHAEDDDRDEVAEGLPEPETVVAPDPDAHRDQQLECDEGVDLADEADAAVGVEPILLVDGLVVELPLVKSVVSVALDAPIVIARRLPGCCLSSAVPL
jgi:hypothetical protein